MTTNQGWDRLNLSEHLKDWPSGRLDTAVFRHYRDNPISTNDNEQLHDLSSDSVVGQRMAISFAIEFHGGLVNGGIEAFRP